MKRNALRAQRVHENARRADRHDWPLRRRARQRPRKRVSLELPRLATRSRRQKRSGAHRLSQCTRTRHEGSGIINDKEYTKLTKKNGKVVAKEVKKKDAPQKSVWTTRTPPGMQGAIDGRAPVVLWTEMSEEESRLFDTYDNFDDSTHLLTRSKEGAQHAQGSGGDFGASITAGEVLQLKNNGYKKYKKKRAEPTSRTPKARRTTPWAQTSTGSFRTMRLQRAAAPRSRKIARSNGA